MNIGSIITYLIVTFGYPVIFLGEAFEGMGIPIPGETMLIGASIYAGVTGNIHIYLIIILSTLGAFTGDNIGYFIGRKGGNFLLERHGHKIGVTEKRRTLLQKYFDKNGGWIVFVGRFTVLFRMFSPLFAGTNKMPYTTFAPYNLAGCFLWSLTYGTLAYILGKHLPLLYEILRPAGFVLFILALLAITLSITLFLRHERQSDTSHDAI